MKRISLVAIILSLIAFPCFAQKRQSNKKQIITLAKIYKDIVNKKLNDVPSSEGDDPLGTWQFGKNEKREIEIRSRTF